MVPELREEEVGGDGEEEEAEKALQVLQSGELLSRLVRNFNLMKHYGIDPKTEAHPQTALEYKMEENIQFKLLKEKFRNICPS